MLRWYLYVESTPWRCSLNCLLNVTQEGYTTQHPVIWILIGLQLDSRNVGQICTPWFLVDRTHIHAWIMTTGAVNCIDMNDRHRFEKHFGFRFNEFASTSVPSSAFQQQAPDVNTLCWGIWEVVPEIASDVIVQDDSVQGPTLVGSSHLLENMGRRVWDTYLNLNLRMK